MGFSDTIRIMDIAIYIAAGLFGAVMGSFAGAQVWRLRAWQLREDKAAGEKVDPAEWKRLKGLVSKKLKSDRSRCLSCQHELAWYDLVPLVSWLWCRGRCRYCRSWIGWAELLLEIGLAALFVLSLWLWPEPLVGLGWLHVAVWLTGLVLLAILFVYDARWSILPDVINLPFIALGAIFATSHIMIASDPLAVMSSLAGAILILSGLYLFLYLVSKGSWIGFGDVKLGLGLALFLMEWKLAFLALFVANLLGTLLVLPGMLRGTLDRQAKIPFGPLLIVGFVIVWFIGPDIIRAYFSLL